MCFMGGCGCDAGGGVLAPGGSAKALACQLSGYLASAGALAVAFVSGPELLVQLVAFAAHFLQLTSPS